MNKVKNVYIKKKIKNKLKERYWTNILKSCFNKISLIKKLSIFYRI